MEEEDDVTAGSGQRRPYSLNAVTFTRDLLIVLGRHS